MEQATKLLPKWNEFDIDTFLRSFERLAVANGWPEEKLLAIIQPHFSKKAQKVFLNLAADITYNDAKEQLLLAYEIVPKNFVLREKVTKKPLVIMLIISLISLIDGSKVKVFMKILTV